MRMRYMKASGFAIVTAVSREPGQGGLLFKYVCFKRYFQFKHTSLSTKTKKKSRAEHIGQMPYDLQ